MLKQEKQNESGFTLIELAVVLIITGVVTSGGIYNFARFSHNMKIHQTEQSFDLVFNALSTYSQRHKRLPCPADPDGGGIERLGANCFVHNPAEAGGQTLYSNTQGVVPWRELGIPESAVRDGWGRYISYKPAPHLTVNMFTAEMQDTDAADDLLDIHNACRSVMWFDGNGNHVDRAKALFCCNAVPKDDYLGSVGQPTGMSSNWKDQAVIATGQVDITTLAGDSTMPDNVPVLSTNAWLDDETDVALNGTFDEPNHATSATNEPDSPLIRATGHAVTLISHGGNGFLSFMRGQNASIRKQGGVTLVGGVTAGAFMAEQEMINVWPPQVAAGATFHPKVSGNTYDAAGMMDGASDDMVAYLRSDQIFSRVGGASCIRPANLAPNDPPCATGGTYGNMVYLLDTSGSMRSRGLIPGKSRMETAKIALDWVLPLHLKSEFGDPSDAEAFPGDDDPDLIGYSGFNSRARGLEATTAEELYINYNFDPADPEYNSAYDETLVGPLPLPTWTAAGEAAAIQAEISANINAASADGCTPLETSLRQLADILQDGTEEEPTSIVVLSDGYSNCGGADTTQASIDINALYPNLQIQIVDVVGNPGLAAISANTGGTYCAVNTEDGLKSCLRYVTTGCAAGTS